jgi:superoxide reductase
MDGVFKTKLRAADPANLTEREEMHVPVIESPYIVAAGEMFPVTVKVGKNPHDMETGHYIQFIDLYAGEALLTRVTFTPTAPKPKFTCFLVLTESARLRAISFCNLTGFWESEQWVRVE